MRLIFMGTPELAAVCLESLLRPADYQVVAVATQPDRPKGRDLKLQPSPVKLFASRAGIPVLQPERARSEDFIAALRKAEPELIVVAAYGQILPAAILDLPRYGCINVHTSLLPKYRGAAPIQWALLNGDSETGVTMMKMDVGMDTGPILSASATPISPEDTAETLHDRLASLGADLLLKTIPDYVSGKIQPRPQPSEGVSYAPKIKKLDGHIDWQQPATAIWNRIRAMSPWPGAFTYLEAPAPQPQSPPRLLKIWQAKVASASGSPGQILNADKSGLLVGCGEGGLLVQIIQLEGGRRLSAAEFLAGHSHSVSAGVRLT
jgi:methionyl-tRNA formyltransferase